MLVFLVAMPILGVSTMYHPSTHSPSQPSPDEAQKVQMEWLPVNGNSGFYWCYGTVEQCGVGGGGHALHV